MNREEFDPGKYSNCNMADEVVVKLAVEGDQEALNLMFKRYYPLLKAGQQIGCVSYEQLQDYEMEACEEFIKLIRKFDPTKGVPFAGYIKIYLLRNLKHNHIKDYVNGLKCQPDPMEEAEDGSYHGPIQGDFSSHSTLHLQLQEGLASLTFEQRKLLNLKYVKEKTLAEIGEMYHITPQAVAKRLKNILKGLHRDIAAIS